MLLSVVCLASMALMLNLVGGLLIPSSAASPRDLAPRSGAVPRDLAPLERHPVQCHRESDFPGHADIHYNHQWEAVNEFCDKKGTEIMTAVIHDPAMGRYPIVFKHRLRWIDWRWGINYDFFVEWVPGCRTKDHYQRVDFPLRKGGVNCYTIMRDNYLKCKNGGVGGSTQAGCLLYTFNGGRGEPCILTMEELHLRAAYDKKHNIVRPNEPC